LPDYATSPLYDDAERAALELADALTVTTPNISDELYTKLRQFYDEPQLVELAATAAMENYRARFNRVFQIEPNSIYCPVEGHDAGGDGR
jgi:alkylhydroperoxidase family enzyme